MSLTSWLSASSTTHQSPFSFMIPSTDQDVDDVTLGEMLTAAHRSENTRTEKVVDRSRKLDERNSSNAQIRTLLEEQRQTIISEYREKVGHHELHAARPEEERRLLQGQLWRQKSDFREVHQQSLTQMEELRKFQSSTFDTLARRKLIEDQNTFLELSGIVQELQNELNCMDDFKDFFRMLKQFAVETPTLPVDQCHSHLIRYLEECCDSLSYRRAVEKGRQAFGTHMVYLETFLSIHLHFHQRFILKNWINGIRQSTVPFIYSGEKWKARTRSRFEMPVRTVRLFKELWGRPTTTADFWFSLW